MTAGLPVLASGEDSLIKIVIGLIVAVIWVAVQVYQKVTDKGDKSLPPSRPPPQRQAPPPVRHLPQDPPITGQLPPRMKRQKPSRRPPQQPSTPKPTRVEMPASVTARVADVSAFQTVRGVTAAAMSKEPQTTARTPKRSVKAMLTPGNLRKAFVLTEILSLPAAMRDDGDRITH